MQPILTLACVVVLLLSCAGAPPPPTCHERLVDVPPPPDPCLSRAEGRDYMLGMVEVLADRLIGWRSSPGAAEVTLAFDATGHVESVCLGPTEGERVSARAPQAVADLEELPQGPACLAGRKVVLAWESPVVTDEEIEAAAVACRPVTNSSNASIGMCRITEECTDDRLRYLFDTRDQLFAECMLRSLPLSVLVPREGRIVNFLPRADVTPTKDTALLALAECDPPATSDSLVACMRERGWEPEL